MSLSGGNFITQNKVLNGAYINFVSAKKASATISDRGVAAVPMVLDWGMDNEIFSVTTEDFQKESLKIFGYSYDAPQMKPLRELFKNIKKGYFYKLMNAGTFASNTLCTAKYAGQRGNDLKIVVSTNVDEPEKMDVSTYLGSILVDRQTAKKTTNELIENGYVKWKTAVTLEQNAGLSLSAGSNGAAVTAKEYQSFLDKIEAYSFNTLGCPTTDSSISDLFVAFTKRMRDHVGAKFQTIVYRNAADYEGVISVENAVLDDANAAALVYWVTGAEAACLVNKSVTNKKYDGEYSVNTNYKQVELENGVKAGKFMMRKVSEDIRVLDDINSFVTLTEEKGSDFKSNQTVRVIDQIANDVALLFNTKYLGEIPNNPSGRISFWNDLVDIFTILQKINAIEAFKPDDIQVTKGTEKKAIVVDNVVTPVNAMGQLYMTTIVQ